MLYGISLICGTYGTGSFEGSKAIGAGHEGSPCRS